MARTGDSVRSSVGGGATRLGHSGLGVPALFIHALGEGATVSGALLLDSPLDLINVWCRCRRDAATSGSGRKETFPLRSARGKGSRGRTRANPLEVRVSVPKLPLASNQSTAKRALQHEGPGLPHFVLVHREPAR